MGMQKTRVTIGGEEKTLVVINHNEEAKTVSTSKGVDQIHHIHILDRSGSMRAYINELIDNVQETLKVINENDLISIIWFSSPNQFRTLVKGARKSDNLDKVLDSIRSVLYTTCFSEPLKEVNSIIDELYTLCPNISITLFTDGNPVVPWPVPEEYSRIFREIERMKDKIIAFNTVGYGNWYDRDLLVKMAAMSEYGTFLHSSKIGDYSAIFNQNFDKINDAVCESVSIGTEFVDDKIIYLNRKFTKMSNNNFDLSRTDKEKNQFFILTHRDDILINYNGEDIHTQDITQKPTDATVNNFLYALAYNEYYAENTQISFDILAKNLHDKSFVDELLGAFTYDERSKLTDRLFKAVFKPNTRYEDGKCNDNYVPDGNAFCVMDLLYLLQARDALYIPFGTNIEAYKRIGRKTEDSYNVFEMTKDEIRAPFSNFVWNKKHMNLSIMFYIKGTVLLNPASAKRVGLNPTFETGIFRNHTIIKDGTLNIKKIEVLLSEELLQEINAINPDIIESIVNIDGDGARAVLNLEALPIINRSYIDKATRIDEIFNLTVELSKLEAREKLIGYYLKKSGEVEDKPIHSYTPEQMQVLEEHGIDKSLNYKGVENKRASTEESDSYETRTMEFYLSGCSSWPKVDDLLTKLSTGKKLTTALDIMRNEYEFLNATANNNQFALDELNSNGKSILAILKTDTKKELTKNRAELSTLKMAKILTGDFFPGLESNDKGEYQYAKNGLIMVAKVARTKEYF